MQQDEWNIWGSVVWKKLNHFHDVCTPALCSHVTFTISVKTVIIAWVSVALVAITQTLHWGLSRKMSWPHRTSHFSSKVLNSLHIFLFICYLGFYGGGFQLLENVLDSTQLLLCLGLLLRSNNVACLSLFEPLFPKVLYKYTHYFMSKRSSCFKKRWILIKNFSNSQSRPSALSAYIL